MAIHVFVRSRPRAPLSSTRSIILVYDQFYCKWYVHLQPPYHVPMYALPVVGCLCAKCAV